MASARVVMPVRRGTLMWLDRKRVTFEIISFENIRTHALTTHNSHSHYLIHLSPYFLRSAFLFFSFFELRLCFYLNKNLNEMLTQNENKVNLFWVSVYATDRIDTDIMEMVMILYWSDGHSWNT